MKILLWKEAREQSSLVLVFVAICYGLKTFFWWHWPEGDQQQLAGQVVLIGMPILGLVLGGAAIARELDHKTMGLLLTRPVARSAIWASKVLTIAGCLLVAALSVAPLLGHELFRSGSLEPALAFLPMVALATSCALACSFFTRNSIRAAVLGALAAILIATGLAACLPDGPFFAMALVAALLVAASYFVLARADLFNLRSRLRVGLGAAIGLAPLACAAFVAHSWLTLHHPSVATLLKLTGVPAQGLLVEQWAHDPWLEPGTVVDAALTIRPLRPDWTGPRDLDGEPGQVLSVSPDGTRWLVIRERNAFGLPGHCRLQLWSQRSGWRTLAGQERSRRGVVFDGAVWSPDGSRLAYLKLPDAVKADGRWRYPWELWTVQGDADPRRVCGDQVDEWSSTPVTCAFSPDGRELWLGRGARAAVLTRFDLATHSALEVPRSLLAFSSARAGSSAGDQTLGELERLETAAGAGLLVAEVDRGAKRASALYCARPASGSWQMLVPEVSHWELGGPGACRLVAQADRRFEGTTLTSRDLSTGAETGVALSLPVISRLSPDGKHVALLRKAGSAGQLKVTRSGATAPEPVSPDAVLLILDAVTLKVVSQSAALEMNTPPGFRLGHRRTSFTLLAWVSSEAVAVVDAGARHDPSPGRVRLFHVDGREERL